jgi:diaminopimelate decarboxylase
LNGFHLKNHQWYADNISLSKIGEKFGTPSYIYSLTAFEDRFKEINQAYHSVPHLVAYSLKANSNLAVVKTLAKLGSGADVVSGGELFRALKAGVPADKIIYAGVGKTDEEIAYALREKIRYFNVESLPEIEAINEVSRKLKKVASIAIRFNPDVDPHTHHYITTGKKETKFGIDLGDVQKVIQTVRACAHVKWTAIHAHIGSQMTTIGPVGKAAKVVGDLVIQLRQEGFPIYTVNLGGGYGIDYQGEKPPKASQYAALVIPVIKKLNATLILEPGRFISGNSGVLLTRVIYVKQSGSKTFYIVDSGMGDLIRPSLYEAYHRIAPVIGPQKAAMKVDVVGPICESGDFLAKDRRLPKVKRGDLLVVFSVGAYGSVMGSTYNSRPLAPEIVVRGNRFSIARRRQTIQDLIHLEM